MTDLIIQDYITGASLRDLAKRYPWSHTSIGTILEEAGVPRRRVWGLVKVCPICSRSFRARRDQVSCSIECRRPTKKAA